MLGYSSICNSFLQFVVATATTKEILSGELIVLIPQNLGTKNIPIVTTAL